MKIDLFGLKAAKKVEELSNEIVLQAKRTTETLELKLIENNELQLKARTQFLSSFNNFNTQIFPHYGVIKEQLIYQTLDDLYSVVSRIATMAAMIPFYGEYLDGSELKPKDKLNAFLKTLTFEQKEIAYTYLLLQGEIFGYKQKIEFGVNAGLQSIKFINPANITVYISRSFPIEIVGYRYYDSVNGDSFDIAIEDMMFIKLFNPDADPLMQVRGLSPVRVLAQRLTRVKAGLDISVAQMQNGGVPGVLYEKTIGIEAGTMGKRQDNFARYLSNSSNKGAPFMTAGDLGYFALGSTLADLDLATLADIDLDKICNVYHVSSTEFNNKKASTESNVGTHSRSFYTNGTLPIVLRLKDGLNKDAISDIDTTGILKEDLSDIIELQPNMLQKAQGYAASPIMTPNDVREGLGQKRIEGDPNMDKVYIKSGYQPIEDLNIVDDQLANTANDYVKPIANA